ncbi:hypothetical protein HMPREF9373_1382 [Psychrobacter sp. 1501(2011)]|nr:hypothetical protein HMPREF9373_1382 [Psychrobacter sp. 1501(2011)]
MVKFNLVDSDHFFIVIFSAVIFYQGLSFEVNAYSLRSLI